MQTLAKTYSGTVVGVEARTVEIEVCSSSGSPQFTIVGLPDTAVKESKDRVVTAIANSGYKRPVTAITINLAPADVRKEGPAFDLPIAIALLVATHHLQVKNLGDWAMVGELALSGEIRHVRGVLPIALEMRRLGKRGILVPAANAQESSVVDGIAVYPVRTLREAADFLAGTFDIPPVVTSLAETLASTSGGDDFADVKGQTFARRAIEVAVAGGHNLLMCGSPGSGKTMLARRIPSILPPLSPNEALDVTRIHSAAGKDTNLITHRPFRAPHHTISDAGLLGGGAHPVPGEVSLAHHGVLFLDEFPEFHRNVLEVLRQPLEDGHVAISRATATCDFPSRFMLVAAMNPCPCGYWGDPYHECHCAPQRVQAYRNRISGPLLDRIDLQIEVPPVPTRELTSLPYGESSATIRARVLQARAIQRARYKSLSGVNCNADVKSRYLPDVCHLDGRAQARLRFILESLNLSARAYDRVLRVARTIADLNGSEAVLEEHIVEATAYRTLDRHDY